jgi:hypothetical protein
LSVAIRIAVVSALRAAAMRLAMLGGKCGSCALNFLGQCMA